MIVKNGNVFFTPLEALNRSSDRPYKVLKSWFSITSEYSYYFEFIPENYYYKLALEAQSQTAGDSWGAVGIAVGTGTTPVAYDDINLANPLCIISNSTAIAQDDSYEQYFALNSINALSHFEDEYTSADTVTPYFYVVSCSVTNITQETITIRELGVFIPFAARDADWDIAWAMITREVLSEPIVIAPGETVMITTGIS